VYPKPTLLLEGSPNFRDLGGYPTQDGRRVRHGLVYRSGDSSALTGKDIERLRALAPRAIVDLRSNVETAMSQIRWPIGKDTEFVAANILADMRAGNRSLTDLLLADPTPHGASRMMETTYAVLPHALGPTIARIAKFIVEEDRLPLIFHCSVGRDRAGITAAMLLHALGVPRDTMIADYFRTNLHFDAESIREITRTYLGRGRVVFDSETLDILTFTRIEHFHAAFRTVAVEYGSVDAYLDAIGVDAAMREGLRERLLERI
jgi:protein-tyrosine phosphatase